jgi:hypothetical protein
VPPVSVPTLFLPPSCTPLNILQNALKDWNQTIISLVVGVSWDQYSHSWTPSPPSRNKPTSCPLDRAKTPSQRVLYCAPRTEPAVEQLLPVPDLARVEAHAGLGVVHGRGAGAAGALGRQLHLAARNLAVALLQLIVQRAQPRVRAVARQRVWQRDLHADQCDAAS